MTLAHDQAIALAAFVHTLRPDWDVPGIVHHLGQARFRGDTAGVSFAAIAAALDPANRTPAVIAMDGKHWNHAAMHVPRREYDHPCRRCGHWHGDADPCYIAGDVDVRSYTQQAKERLRGRTA